MADSPRHAILLVDDEPEVLFSLKGLLRREFDLYTANSAAEALQILQEHPIHVIMTDQRMPEMTGSELMHRARTQYPDAVRIVFTGYADIKAVIQAINEGGVHRYITKPWDPDELIDVLKSAARRYDQITRSRELLTEAQQLLLRFSQAAESADASSGVSDPELLATGAQLADRIGETLKSFVAD